MELNPTSRVITVAPSYTFYHEGRAATVAGAVILSAWIIFSNLTLIISILSSDRRRKVSFNLHVTNMAITSLVMGGLVLPLHIDFELKGRWHYSENVCRLWLVADLMACSLSVLVTGMMVFERFVFFSCSSIAEGGGKFVFSAATIIIPWALSSAFHIPVYMNGETGVGLNSTKGICYLDLDTTHSIISILGGYFIPSLAAFGILVAMTLTWCVRRADLTEMREWIDEIDGCGWQVLMSWIISVAVFGMWLPFSAIYLIHYLMDTRWPLQWLEPAVWIAYANAGVTPLLWMLMPTIREGVTRMCFCCCKRKGPRPTPHFRSDHNIEDDAHVSMLEFRYKK